MPKLLSEMTGSEEVQGLLDSIYKEHSEVRGLVEQYATGTTFSEQQRILNPPLKAAIAAWEKLQDIARRTAGIPWC